MKREDVKKIFGEASDEQITALLNINSADIGKAKGDYDKLKGDFDTQKNTLADLTKELDALKETNASAEDWKEKYKKLSDDIEVQKKKTEEERQKAEKDAEILSRYEAAAVSKDGKPLKWTHEAIKNDYLQKFSQALEDKANAGKSDADIFNMLTKDDGVAFDIPRETTVYESGGNGFSDSLDDAKIDAIMGITTK